MIVRDALLVSSSFVFLVAFSYASGKFNDIVTNRSIQLTSPSCAKSSDGNGFMEWLPRFHADHSFHKHDI